MLELPPRPQPTAQFRAMQSSQPDKPMRKRLTDLLPATERRVLDHSSKRINEENRRRIAENVRRYAGASIGEIDKRIKELEAEWDMERALETAASVNVGFGVAMGMFVNRRWFAWSGIVAAFLLQHALQGWCPPVPVLRRLGIRTAAEIDEEKTALRILRGDFHETDDPEDAIEQVRSGGGFHPNGGGPIIL